MKPPREDDRTLWEAFTQDVTPLDAPKVAEASRPMTKPERAAMEDATRKLDADIAKALATRSPNLDLHGLTVAQAYAATTDFLTTADGNHRTVTVITGLSGSIKQEFPHWFEGNKSLSIEEVNGGGAYRIRFKRRK